MTDLSQIPEAVQWHEGMLLAPQHFQQAWLRSEALLGYAVAASGLFPWGIRRLTLDRAMLASGKVRLLVLEAVMPDGLAVLHPREDEPLLELDLAEFKDQLAEAPMAVHVTVPVDQVRPEPGQVRRWRSVEGRPVADSNSGEGEVPIPRLRPALGLALTESPLVPPQRQFVSLPIARVGFRDDAFALEPFAPPRMDIPAGSELAALTRGVAQRLREKASAIAERLQSAGAEAGELPGGGLLEALRSMVALLPRLEGLVQAESVHPYLVYLTLCDLMGEMAWMGGQPVPPPPPTYRHDDALPAFDAIIQFLGRMLARVRENYRAIRFQRLGDDRFSLTPDEAMLAGESVVIGARTAQGASPGETAEWFAKALIGSRSMMKTIGERRMRGAGRARIEMAEEFGLVPPASMVLFRVSVEPGFIQAGQPLDVTGTGSGLEPADIQLFAAEAEPVTPPPDRAKPAKPAGKPPPRPR